jgi:hypothetical protein
VVIHQALYAFTLDFCGNNVPLKVGEVGFIVKPTPETAAYVLQGQYTLWGRVYQTNVWYTTSISAFVGQFVEALMENGVDKVSINVPADYQVVCVGNPQTGAGE